MRFDNPFEKNPFEQVVKGIGDALTGVVNSPLSGLLSSGTIRNPGDIAGRAAGIATTAATAAGDADRLQARQNELFSFIRSEVLARRLSPGTRNTILSADGMTPSLLTTGNSVGSTLLTGR